MNLRLLLFFFLLTFQASAQTIPSYIPQNGLMGYWPFSGNANDESVNSNNGIVYPNTTLTQDRFNNSNNAYLFDNSVQSGIQTNTPLTYSTTGISGSLWFNTNVFLNSSAGHRQFISGTSSIPFQFAYNNGGVDLEVYNQFGGLTVFTWPSIFIPNSWHHVAFSVNTNGNVLISIDGQVYNAGSSPNSLRTANNSAYIFGLSSSAFWPNPFSGKLDDIAIWNRALSQQEIQQLYSGISCVPPTASINTDAPTSFCSGGNVLLSAPLDTSYTYLWQLNGSTIYAATASTYTANASGNYSVIISNGESCSDTSAVTSVTLNPLPTATITAAGATTFCAGANVVLNANTGTGLTYQWKLNDSNISGATAASYTASAAGLYSVLVTNALSCSSTSSATTVTVNPLPTATITAAGSPSICTGTNIILNANTGKELAYQWKLNGTNITGATSASYLASATGSYTVLVTSASICSATSSETIVTVNTLPSTPTISAAGATTFCSGANVLLNVNSGSGLLYQWKLNGTNITGATSASYSASAQGGYSIVVSNASNCSAASNVISITVNALPNVNLTSLPDFVNIQTPSVALNGSPAGGSYSGQGISGTNFIPSTAGLGQAVVSYSFTSTAGCSGNIVKNTIVYDTIGTFCTTYDTIYTSINDTVLVSVQDTLIIETLILGSNPIQSNEIKVYPNPAHSFLEIDNGNFALMGGYSIRIENSLGQIVFNQAVNQQIFSINLSTWTGDGVYYLHIINSNGITQEIKKIVLQ